MKRYMVSIVPLDTHDAMKRAGQRFTREPREITVRELDPAHPHGPDEVTPEQFAQIEAEPRIKVMTSGGKVVSAGEVAAAAEGIEPKAAPDPDHAAKERRR